MQITYLGLGEVLGHEGPFHAGRKSRAAAPAQIRFLHFVDELFRSELLQCLVQSLVGAELQGNIDFARILDAPAFADERSLELVAFVKRAGSDGYGSGVLALVELLNKAIKVAGGDVLVEIVVHLHGWRASAGANTLDLFQREHAIFRGFAVADFQALFRVFEQLRAAAQHAGHVGANLHVVLADGLAV